MNHLPNVKNNRGKSLLVTGAAGFIGSNLLKSFSLGGHSVVGLYRSKMPESLNNIYPVCTDLGNAEMLKIPLRGVEQVVHLAWDQSEYGHTQENNGTLRAGKNIEATRILLQAMEQSGTKRIIFLSVPGASPKAASPLAREKYFAEHLIINSRIPEKIILRVAPVMGPMESGFVLFKNLKELLSIPFIAPLPNKRHLLRPVHVNDLIVTINTLINRQDEQNCLVYNLIGSETIRLQEVVLHLQKQIDRRARLRIGGAIGELLIRGLETIQGKHGKNALLSRWSLADQSEEAESNFTEALGLKNLTSIRQSLLCN